MIKLISSINISTMIRLTFQAFILAMVYRETHAAWLVFLLILLTISTELSAILHRSHSIKLDLILKFAEEIHTLSQKINTLRRDPNDKA